MNKRILTSLALTVLSVAGMWANTVQTVAQVGQAVTLTTDVDYTITSTTPFLTDGSVDIQNIDHAVVIIQNIKPSKVLADGLLDHILIQGEKAVDGKNCDVRMYAHGTIIFPYAAGYKPLTVYDEQNCKGQSSNAFGLENTGGYMNNMTAAKLNNRVRSFVLKRGYMVTFAIGQAGWGYSRCFIAHDEDLVVNTLPAILDQRISSYRVFKWVYAQKKGLASNGNKEANSRLNTSWCYDWAQGNAGNLPDQEWVPNHIYEDYPSSATIGSVTGSCHTKCNNEPANSADDHPQSVEVVLNNWQNMMRTGLRLCSPATHDGGWGWHNEFMKEIDARGWRCDIVDFHGYWDGEWNSLDWYIDTYAHGRPVWFSEWVWGSSWGKKGIFSQAPDGKDSFSKANQQKCYDGTKPILDRLNSNDRVERYAYWNSEADASKILRGNELSILGQYYAEMKSGMGYKASRQFVPKEPTVTATTDLTATFNRKNGIVSLIWTEGFGDLVTAITLQRKAPGGSWKDLRTFTPRDQNSKAGVQITAADTLAGADPGEYEYRVKDVTYNKKSLISNTVSVAISSQQIAGDFTFGNANVPLAFDPTSNTTIAATAVYADLEGYEDAPLAFLGLPTYKNTGIGVTSFLNSVGKNQIKFGAMPWTTGFTGQYSKTETIDYVAVPEGTYLFGNMQVIAGKSPAYVGNEWTEVTFPTPFAPGDTPVVVCQPYMTNLKYATVVRVCDVTNTGFRVRHIGQSAQSTVAKKSIYYLAASCAQASLPDGYLISAGRSSAPVGGKVGCNIAFETQTGDTLMLQNPTILCGPQTDRLDAVASTFRIGSIRSVDTVSATGTAYKATIGLNLRRQMDESAGYKGTNTASENGDTIGWIILSPDPSFVSEEQPDTTENAIHAAIGGTKDVAYYTLDGKRVTSGRLRPGVYILRDALRARKVVIK